MALPKAWRRHGERLSQSQIVFVTVFETDAANAMRQPSRTAAYRRGVTFAGISLRRWMNEIDLAAFWPTSHYSWQSGCTIAREDLCDYVCLL